MTREEQIEQAAKKYAVSNDNDPNLTWARECAFMQGAVWADEHPQTDAYEQGYKDAIDKFCEYMQSCEGYVVSGEKCNYDNFMKFMEDKQ